MQYLALNKTYINYVGPVLFDTEEALWNKYDPKWGGDSNVYFFFVYAKGGQWRVTEEPMCG